MSFSVTMPALGESVTEGTITRWLKKEGDRVEVDEPLLEISTDKVDTEIPSPAAGVLTSIVAKEDDTVEVGAELAVIGDEDGGAPAEAAQAPAPAPAPAVAESSPQPTPSVATPTPPAAPAASPAPSPVSPPAPMSSPAAAPISPPQAAPSAPSPTPAVTPPAQQASVQSSQDNGNAPYVTPLVRKLATQQGVDLGTIKGTGVGGRIRKQDILDAASPSKTQAVSASPVAKPAAPSPLRGRTEKMSRLRTVIARRMVESLQTAAQLTTVVEVDVTRIARLRQEAKENFMARHGAKLSFMPFFAVAAVEALREHPALNSTIDMEAGTITYHDVENLSIAVDTERGLLAPVITRAGDLNLGGVARAIADIAERTRNNTLTPDELSGGTFTLTNTGSRGALIDTPIINLPQTAILGTGSVVKRAMVVDDPDLGEIILPRSMVYLSLTYDHRIVDGADAARYLNAVKDRLEAGAFEADLGLG